MSEFKFSVGQRVAVRCNHCGYYYGTIISRYKSIFNYTDNLYKIKKDEEGEECSAQEGELTRLVKKNPWGGFKVGQRVFVNSANHGKFTGIVVERGRLIEDSPALKIKPDKVFGFHFDCWLVDINRCKLIEDEKPKPKREPLRVGEWVVIKEGKEKNENLRVGEIGVIDQIDLDAHWMMGQYKIKFPGGDFQYVNEEQLKRLIKKPVEFKVGDKVRVKKVLGVKDLPEFKSKVIHVEIMDGHKMLRVDNPINPSDANWLHVRPQDCVKLRKRRLRVGDRVSGISRVTEKKHRGVIINYYNYPGFSEYRIKSDDGYEILSKPEDCKRLVKRKRYEHGDPRMKAYYEESARSARSFFERLFGEREKENHIPASGKKVDEKSRNLLFVFGQIFGGLGYGKSQLAFYFEKLGAEKEGDMSCVVKLQPTTKDNAPFKNGEMEIGDCIKLRDFLSVHIEGGDKRAEGGRFCDCKHDAIAIFKNRRHVGENGCGKIFDLSSFMAQSPEGISIADGVKRAEEATKKFVSELDSSMERLKKIVASIKICSLCDGKKKTISPSPFRLWDICIGCGGSGLEKS